MLRNRSVYKRYLEEKENVDTAILEVTILKDILEQKGRKLAVCIADDNVFDTDCNE